MWISKEKYKLINMELSCVRSRNIDLIQEVNKLRVDLHRANDLKDILNQLAQRVQSETKINGGIGLNITGGDHVYNIELGDHVPVYVDDLFGGKVIKQEANKAIKIDKHGNVKTGLTKQKVDTGYNYRLEREK